MLEFNDMTCFQNLKLSTSLIHTDEIELTIQHTEVLIDICELRNAEYDLL